MKRRALLLSSAWVLAPCGARATCVSFPAPQINLSANGYYTDAHHSEVSAELKQRNHDSTAPGRRFLDEVSRAADRFHAGADAPDAAVDAQCGLGALKLWADAGALLGEMQGPSHGQQAEYERKWLLAGLSLAYLKLRPAADAGQREAIEPWLRRVADAMWRFWEEPGGNPTRHKHNNHYTWAGLALAATALATGDTPRWERAHRVFTESLAEVQPDGRLPLEMARGGRALHYHAFTAGPLVVMAELSRSKARGPGGDWLAQADASAAMQRLVDAILDGLAAPDQFANGGRSLSQEAKAEKTQTQKQEMPTPAALAWLALWQLRDRQPQRITRWLQGLRPVPTLGGDLVLMARRGW